ncbi:MAG: AAA family ATPase [Spirochaetia bacterium]|nr:AAA family ATPase [Spirochaetia bacterium]
MVDVFEDKTQAPKETQYFNFGQNIQIKNFDEAIQKYAELIYNDKLKDLSGQVDTNVPNQYKSKFIFKPNSNAGRLVLNGRIIPVVINHMKKFQYPDFSNPQTKKKCLAANAFVAPYRLIFQILTYMEQVIEKEAYLTYDEVFQYVYLQSLKEDLSHPNIASIVNRIIKGREQKVFYNAHKTLYENFWNQPWRQYHEEIVEIMVISGLITRDEDYTIKLISELTTRQKKYLAEIVLYNDFLMSEVTEEDYANYFDLTDDDLSKYMEEEHMKETKPFTDLNYKPISKDKKYKSYNRIIFGAPGTGKSFQLKQESTDGNHFANIERVTFHPDYSYGQFVGSYKPVSDDEGGIRYEYVPGPFMRTLVKALESGKNGDSAEKFLLIVEEINRAKVAAVFGDMFQLLDRTDEGDSVYEIQASEDVRRYLARELGGTKENYTSIKIPNNMYIWATMNSADQGVFPMDTAFKRRWEFIYLSINANEKKIAIEDLPIINGDAKIIKWNILRKSINNMLLKECKVNEDKLLGPFFISGEVFKNATSNPDEFFNAFNSKVLMYLFEDAGKMHQKKLFAGIDQNELTFSKVCEDFKTRGTAIFGNSFQLVKE